MSIERGYPYYSTISEANTDGKLDTVFCIGEMPVNSIIVYGHKEYRIKKFIQQDMALCTRGGKEYTIDASENALYSVQNYQYYSD